MTYIKQETKVIAKLYINADHFKTEEAKMNLVYRYTGGKARTYIHPKYKFDVAIRFTSYSEMLICLRNIIISPYVR